MPMDRPAALDQPKGPARSKLLRAWADMIYHRPAQTWSNADKLDLQERFTDILAGIEAE
jgi:hypothetical protein